MASNEQRILEALRRPRTQAELASSTGLHYKDVAKLVKKLQRQGLIVSRGYTSARKHMTLAAAIDVLFDQLHRVAQKAGINASDKSWL